MGQRRGSRGIREPGSKACGQLARTARRACPSVARANGRSRQAWESRRTPRLAEGLAGSHGGAPQKDVKNEGCSQDVVENKGRETTECGMANIFMKINDLSIMPIYC